MSIFFLILKGCLANKVVRNKELSSILILFLAVGCWRRRSRRRRCCCWRGVAGYYGAVPLVTKYLWRKGYLRFPEECSNAEALKNGKKTSSCRASCPAELYESRGMTAYDVLVDVNALHWLAGFTSGKLVGCVCVYVVGVGGCGWVLV